MIPFRDTKILDPRKHYNPLIKREQMSNQVTHSLKSQIFLIISNIRVFANTIFRLYININ